jgi:hypothetical protein
MIKHLGVVLLLVACGGGHATPPPPSALLGPVATGKPPTAAECDTAVGEMFDRMIEGMRGEIDKLTMTDPEEAKLHKVTELMIEGLLPKLEVATSNACTADAWSEPMLYCVRSADLDYDKCADKALTPAQKEHADAAMTKVMDDLSGKTAQSP